MYADVVDLRDFYRTPLGQVARRMLQRHVRALWPNVAGMTVLGLGYATPFLAPLVEEAGRVLVAMPAAQGVLAWPREGPNRCFLTEDAELPLPDLSVDRAILVHALESSEHVRPLLRELWRVLAGGGRLLVVVPNRRGIWARRDLTPFGYGHPFTVGQLSRLLREGQFTPVRSSQALFVPPTRSRMLLRSAGAWERLGTRWFPHFAGVVMIEAGKQIYAATPARGAAREAVRRPRPAMAGGGALPAGRGCARRVAPADG